MSGKVIYRPDVTHECDPNIPARDHDRGTAWQCDECGGVFRVGTGIHGLYSWNPETRRERREREKSTRARRGPRWGTMNDEPGD